ncbi:MAG: dTMP kinase [Candidatus Pacebacteria bacterium]|nr:dTMP kinase [Candidatus Paceibacterota bacterium]
MKNKFIAICGGEGSGKSTMVAYLRELYPAGLTVSREPGGSPFAEAIRITMFSEGGRDSTPETQFGLAWAARSDHMTKLVIPALGQGPVVLDRFDCCTFAYQIHGGEAPHLKDLFWQVRERFLVRKPDLYIFFDVDPATGLARAAARKGPGNFFDERRLPFHERIRVGYLEFLQTVPHVTIDANQPLEQVKAQFATIIQERLG